jgi:phosphoglycerate dehydrogenase-like enzyme
MAPPPEGRRLPIVAIASPLEAEHVARIRAAGPGLEVLYAPDLLPPTRYVADHKGVPMTRTPEQQTRWRAMLGRAEILWDLPAAEDVPFCTALRWIQTTSTGVGQSVARLGVPEDVLVTTARGVHAGPLAEFVFMALLLHWRGLPYLQAEQRAHRWVRYCNEGVAGRTLVVLGAGDLARGCARLARAFGVHTLVVARDAAKLRQHNDLFDEIVPVAALPAALARADAVVVAVPHTPLTEGLLDAAAFAALRPGAAVINIARGQVVDEDALIAALRLGRVGFAALDVARTEPLPDDSPLWDMPNVLISPHSASTVLAENAAITDIFVHNLRCWLDGQRGAMRNVLDRTLMY